MAGLNLDATDWDCQVWLGWILMLQTGTGRYGWGWIWMLQTGTARYMAGLDLDAADWDCQVWLDWIWMLQTGTARYGWIGFGCYRLGLQGMAGAGLG
jgi:hypothetical protein